MSQERTLRRLERQIWELLAWRNVSTTYLEHWAAIGADGRVREIRVGDRWDDLGSPVRLETTLGDPAPPGSLLEFFAEGDGLVFLDNRLVGTVSPFEREVSLGDSRHLAIEISPNDSFGEIGRSARLITARVLQPDCDMRALHRSLLIAWETCAQLRENDAIPALLAAIDESINLLTFPTDAATVLHRTAILRDELKLGLEPARSLNNHYHYDIPVRSIERLLGDTMRLDSLDRLPLGHEVTGPTGVREALEHLNTRVAELTRVFPPIGQLAATSHAHLDVAWLWPLSETRRKIRHTFASVLSLMDRYPGFHFTASSAQLFAYVQQDDPELFERVRARVGEGRIEPIGGMWLEPDCNLPSGEALARHLLYGQRFFDREFGRRSTVAWLPDTFGFAPNLPQILTGGGIESFFTQKLSWNDTNRFPHDLWLWEGIDGTDITAHSFENPIGGYNGVVAPEAFAATWRNFRGKSSHPESLFTFGMGDGGRGPTSEMLDRLAILDNYPTLPSVRQTTVEEFFEEIDPANLPIWLGELYLEFHRGTYTTQARIKRLNRMAEHRLQEAEIATALASLIEKDYPRADLDDLWTTLLRNQFHDILPGSSITVVNEQAEEELGSVVRQAIAIRDRAVGQMGKTDGSSGDGERRSVIIFNPQGFERPLSCVLPGPIDIADFRLVTVDGTEVFWQPTAGGDVLIHDPRVAVPGVGYLEMAIERQSASLPRSGVSATASVIENELLTVTLAPDGSIASLVDKRADREVLDGPANQLRLFRDLPPSWEAWNITDTSHEPGDLLTSVDSARVLENGPLRAVVEFIRSFGASRIIQRYVLRAGSARVDIQTTVDWQERRRLLRAMFPLAIRSPRATFETSYGAVERPTHRNTSWDTAKFEVPGHRWADLSEPGYGVSLLNDGRYGHSVLGNTLGLSLLRSPMDPDPLADLGTHEFTYSIYPHPGDWHDGGTVREAIDLNSPLVALSCNEAVGTAARFGWVEIDGMTLGALKQAEDSQDLVLRLYDPYGRHGIARITPNFPVDRAALTNLLEEADDPLELESDGSVRFPYRPFEIASLRLRRARVDIV